MAKTLWFFADGEWHKLVTSDVVTGGSIEVTDGTILVNPATILSVGSGITLTNPATGEAHLVASTGSFNKVFYLPGALVVVNGVERWYPQFNGTITLVHVAVGTVPTGSGVTVRLNKNGSSLGTVTIAVSTFTNSFVPSTTTFTVGDYFTVDITVIGSTTPGSYLETQIIGTVP